MRDPGPFPGCPSTLLEVEGLHLQLELDCKREER